MLIRNIWYLGSRPSKWHLGLIFFCLMLGSPALAFHVLIDPGHGGADKGATSAQGRESNIALKVSHLLAEHLQKKTGFRVSLTRLEDTHLSLEQRTEICKKLNPDIFVSVHLNSSVDPRARGKEVYFQNQMPADEESMFLASRENEENSSKTSAGEGSDLTNILEDLKRTDRIRTSGLLARFVTEAWEDHDHKKPGHRRLMQAPFHVLAENTAPSILVEIGYLSHPLEGKLLTQLNYQNQIAENLAQGIRKYKESMDKVFGIP